MAQQGYSGQSTDEIIRALMQGGPSAGVAQDMQRDAASKFAAAQRMRPVNTMGAIGQGLMAGAGALGNLQSSWAAQQAADRENALKLAQYRQGRADKEQAYQRGLEAEDRRYQRDLAKEERQFGRQQSLAEMQNRQQIERMKLQNKLAMERERSAGSRAVSNFTAKDEATSQALQKSGIDPNSSQGLQVRFGVKPEAAYKMGPRGEKALIESVDKIKSSQDVIESFDAALRLNDKALSGGYAETRSYLGSLYGDESSVAAQELDNLVKTGALRNLKATFGSMPTEGERKIMLEVQGSVNKPPEVRARIYRRAKKLAAERVRYERAKAKALRDGTFFTGGGEFDKYIMAEKSAQDANRKLPSGQTTSQFTSEAEDALRKGADPAAVRERMIEQGVDPDLVGL